jgi:hypothetical protein
MAKNKHHKPAHHTNATAAPSNRKGWLAPAAIALMLGAATAIFYNTLSNRRSSLPNTAATNTTANTNTAQPGVTTADMGLGAEPFKMKIAQAVMVTVDLDFGGPPPTIAEAIGQIERGYQPDDGQGRTFAILDAYGEPSPEGKLHMSMHVSSEEAGLGTLKFKRTGELLWRARIGQPGEPPAGPKNLMIYLSKGDGTNHVLDGTRGGSSVLDVYLQNSQQRVRDVWPEGAEREVTFVYSACGCPVKVMCRRTGDRTARTSNLPVIFPDDPAAVSTISNLMKW